MKLAEERLRNDPTSELWGEHRARYRFAIQSVLTAPRPDVLAASGVCWPSPRVLDVACGSGFGLQMLESANVWPIGVDLDATALAEARVLNPSARWARSDATCLAFPHASFDLVTSFETIEHVPDAAALVRELRRVLKPDGRLVLSTPNRAFGPPALHTGNPFHIREFTSQQLRELLAECFSIINMFGQWPTREYRYVPFRIVEPDNAPAAVLWKLLNRLPFVLKNRLAHLLTGSGFYPGEADYVFVPNQTDGAHSLVAVAHA